MVVRVLWVCGADAAGKSTVGWEIYDRLTGGGVMAAYLDIDYLGFCTPQPGGDPTWLVERNLAAMWSTFAEAGASCLVAAGVVVTRQQWQRYAVAIPDARAILCRLRVTPQTQADRITRRAVVEAGEGGTDEDMLAALDAYAQRSAQFAAKLEADDFADFTVDTDGVPIKTVADRVQAGIVANGWDLPVP
ncbi:AAA family ATPase [Rugosimonospora africana]|uniref:Uncharacterized protein n=1 Tax=Rugosimonospora africana TaxID=556532 RepID=A0A8J3R0I7_9ACTN|nr:AAA family ATPase [Rugosimonospora africana]GIH19567.1 hypothetical protein Raf01_77390 [Rugosimonospora africana]